jgi:heme-degrading monooxygenase HmoA
MATAAVRHEVKDYDAWKAVYDEHGVVRNKLGCEGDRLLRDSGDPNQVLVLTFWPTLDAANAFAHDPSLPKAMQKAGIVGAPRIEIYEEA